MLSALALEKGTPQGEEVCLGASQPADAGDAPQPADETILKKILSKKVSDATTPEKRKGIASSSSCSKAVGGAAAASPEGLSHLGMSADELAELRQWMLQRTISPLKRKKKKAKPKQNLCRQGQSKVKSCKWFQDHLQHRKTSSGYANKAKRDALNAGKTVAEAVDLARAACQKMSADIDAGIAVDPGA